MATTEPEVDPDLVARYLVEGERVVIAVRRHWVTVVEPIVTAVALLLFVVWVGTTIPADLTFVADFLWWVWFAALGRSLFLLWEWRRTWLIGTDRRLLLTYGVVVRKVAMMPLSKVTDMNYGRSILGRILGYGRFTLESAGQAQALSEMTFVPDPDRHYRALSAEIFARPANPYGTPNDPDRGRRRAQEAANGALADGSDPEEAREDSSPAEHDVQSPPSGIPPDSSHSRNSPAQEEEPEDEPAWEISTEHASGYTDLRGPQT